MQLRNPAVTLCFDRYVTACLWLVAGWFLLIGGASGAGAQTLGGAMERHLSGALVAETLTPAAGSEVMLAFHMTPDAGWHGYWENPGDAGLGMATKWALPQGVTAGKLEYPVPGTLILSGLMNHVYERDYAVLVPLSIPQGLAKGTKLPVRVALSALVCDDKLCLPQDFDLPAELTVGDGAISPESRARFDGWRAKLPRPLTLGPRDAVYLRDGERLRIGVKIPETLALDAPHMFAATQDVVDYAAPQRFVRNGMWLVMETRASAAPDADIQGIDTLLKIGPDKGLRFTAVEGRAGELPSGGTAIGNAPAAWSARLLLAALGGALVGGLLLNIMPCVFPILSLKALSLARAGGDLTEARRDAWAYAAGVVAICLALGLIILGLRSAGEQVGWAFQLQNPVSIFLLLLLVTAITANLAGLFEIGGLSFSSSGPRRQGAASSFWSGVLAALVATPCTGPFMGAALGATILLPGWAALLIFGALGVGLALPFLAIAYSARLRGLLPKPGPWMESFRRWMALPMALTALALAWLLGRMAGNAGWLAAGLGIAILTLLAFVYGKDQRGARRLGWPLLALALVGAGAGTLFVKDRAASVKDAAELAGIPFSEAALAAARASGKPVLVYYTADWCVTCKINEAAAIDRSETAAAFAKAGVQVLVADWTNGDAAITRSLEAQGRNSVPLYLWYHPGAETPEVLPQILTPTMLVNRAGGQ